MLHQGQVTVARANGVEAAFKELLAGNADDLIAGYYSVSPWRPKAGLKDQIEPLSLAILEAEIFVAFSKKSPCRSLVPASAKVSPR
jgi:polar amino acid transport system substrate-binding protein